MLNMLAVIGFDTQLDGLENTDRVAAAFYKGSVDSREPRLAPHYSFSELLQLSADRVLQANKLSGQQLAVIVVSALPQTRLAADNHYIRCEQVACFSDAVTLSKQIINKQDIAVLIIAAHISAQPFQQQATISYDRAFNGYGESSGVASVLLSSANFAARHNSYIYAYLRGFAVTEELSQIAATIKQSFASCALDSDAVSSVEVTASADMQLQAIEQNALLRSYKNALTLQTSLCCIKSVVGDNGPLSELLGFINVVFVLQQRYRAAVKAWQAPHDEQLSAWLDSP
ncbi:MAG: PfaB family protein, partial [Psychromonas sp.]|nr:PfaB family protein [Psychromonas sp.]